VFRNFGYDFGIFPLRSMGGKTEGLSCADREARNPIGASGNSLFVTCSDHLSLYLTIYLSNVDSNECAIAPMC
jgi:hypothetical protein